MLKYGKTAARPDAVKLKFSEVFNEAVLPVPPMSFGHEQLMPGGAWYMLGNNQWGDCVWAGAAHEHMLWSMEGGLVRDQFTTKDVLSDYSAVTGFDPNNPDSDQGTDIQVAAAYRQNTGIIDTNNVRHKIDAYAALRVGDVNQLAVAAYIFGAVGVGVKCPTAMQGQFSNNQPWSVVAGDTIEGGHYVPVIGRNSVGNFLCVTWGRLQAIEPSWVQLYNDESIVYLDLEFINNNTKLTPESYNLDTLTQYLKEV
jgi:hypothetical protein